MDLKGKGFFIWKVKDCEGGDPQTITQAAKQAGFTHVLIKIADGAFPYNINRKTNEDFVLPVVNSLKTAGIQTWGWHYIYGDYPINEGNIAVQRVLDLNLDGYVIDAEGEYKEPGKNNAAVTFMKILRRDLSDLPIALSSYRFPSYHPQLPWKIFLEKCDYNMPQEYWEQAKNPLAQLSRTVREFQAISPFRPIIPTGPTYKAGSWVPSSQEINTFLSIAKKLNLPAVNFFSWDECRPAFPDLWRTISEFNWDQNPTSEKDITDLWISALNSKKPDEVIKLYSDYAVHITATRTIQGLNALRTWYQSFLTQLLPNGKFLLTGSSGFGNSRHLTWTCKSDTNEVLNGNDTFGLLGNKIAYHYSFFTAQ
ncbi:MAG: hypothetical protein CVU39_03990 [Chloroflexi bacterium HGW-Chloroflexi-10]|nr:MAG: hypothetical protein CVU39_03990 [Chloroflexi bacterium HGW-Chloroflexi-10]